jgi:hypothetical protein
MGRSELDMYESTEDFVADFPDEPEFPHSRFCSEEQDICRLTANYAKLFCRLLESTASE